MLEIASLAKNKKITFIFWLVSNYKEEKLLDHSDVVKNWMRNHGAIEFLGLWERINNPNFKLVEFDGFKGLLKK